MDELSALRQELADLRAEVKALKRVRWITPAVPALALAALVVLGVAQQLPPPAGHAPTQVMQDISCKSLKVVDANGGTMLQLASDKDGGMLVINGADAKKRFFAAVENGSGFADWYDAPGARRASIFTGDKNNTELLLNDKLEHAAAVVSQTDTGGAVALKAADGNNRLLAGVDNGAGFLDISDNQAKLRESLYISDKNTAQFKALGIDATPRFLVSGNEDGGQAISYNTAGAQRATFPAAKE